MDGTAKIHELIGLVEDHTDALRTFCNAHGVSPQVSLVARVAHGADMAAPHLELATEELTWLQALGASFTIDYTFDPPKSGTAT